MKRYISPCNVMAVESEEELKNKLLESCDKDLPFDKVEQDCNTTIINLDYLREFVKLLKGRKDCRIKIWAKKDKLSYEAHPIIFETKGLKCVIAPMWEED